MVSRKKHSNPSIGWKSKFVLKTGQTSFVVGILFLFVASQDKWVVPIGIHNIDALVSQKKHLNPSIGWELIFALKNETNIVRGKHLVSFHEGLRQMDNSHWDARYLCLGFVKKYLNPSFCWESKFVLTTRQTSFVARI